MSALFVPYVSYCSGGNVTPNIQWLFSVDEAGYYNTRQIKKMKQVGLYQNNIKVKMYIYSW